MKGVLGHFDGSRSESVWTAVEMERQLHAIELKLNPLHEQKDAILGIFQELQRQSSIQAEKIERLSQQNNLQLGTISKLEAKLQQQETLKVELTTALEEKAALDRQLKAAGKHTDELNERIGEVRSLFFSQKELEWMKTMVLLSYIKEAGISLMMVPVGGIIGICIGACFGPVGVAVGGIVGVTRGGMVGSGQADQILEIDIHYRRCLALQKQFGKSL